MSCVKLLLRYILVRIILSDVSNARQVMFKSNRNWKPRPRVIGGYNDDENKYPYVVALEYPTRFSTVPFLKVCTGSLISSRFVLTAAHCLTNNVQLVRCGNMSIPVNESTCKSKVIKAIPHHSFINTASTSDIALLLIEKLEMSSYGRLNFADYWTLIGRKGIYAGFGDTNRKKSTVNKKIEQEDIPLQIGEGVIFKDDNILYRMRVSRLLIAPKCSKRNQYVYSGDSGGPLFVDNKIAGVAYSVASQRSHKMPPSYFTYTPISQYVDWIKEAMKNHGPRE